MMILLMRFKVLFSLLLFLAGMTAGGVLTARLQTKTNSTIESSTHSFQNQTTALADQRLLLASKVAPATLSTNPNFTNIAADAIQAVANIASRQVIRQRSNFNNDPFFRYFFGESPNFSDYRERPSLGSGVIVRSDGYILTNAHVVGRQTAGITVTLVDNREFEAELVGRDESTDIALLRIETENLHAIPWGNSASLRIAEWVLAIGNPFQLNQTVTLGIVSAVGRDNLGVAQYENFIQTDAAINPGNSGGALINTRGELIGINTAIYSESGGYQGVGFAIPSNLARRVMEDLIQYGQVRRGSFGYIDVRMLTTQLANELGAPNATGVVVWRIHQDSAAARAGIQPGDIIVSFNEQLVEDPSNYERLLSDAEINSTVTLQIIRAGRLEEFQVTVSQARQQ